MTGAEPSPDANQGLERAILALLARRDAGATICPSEVARTTGGEAWRELMEPVRAAARRLVVAGEVEITQGGDVVDPTDVRGPIRIRRAGTTHRRVRLDQLGAWLLKGNADAVDLLGRFERDPHIESWCVQRGYRARLMDAGQRVVFWASGSRGRLPYGVWGSGVLTGPVVTGSADGRWRVPVDLTIDDPARWIRRPTLRADPRLAGAEVFRQPQAANPSFLTVDQFTALQDHLDAAHRPLRAELPHPPWSSGAESPTSGGGISDREAQ